MSIKDKFQKFGIQHPKLFTLGIGLTITFIIGITIGLTFIITANQFALGQEKTSPFKGMNFSKPSDVYSNKQGILNVSLIVEEKQGVVGNQSVTAMVYNGSLMAPTLHIKPGERLVMNYVNRLDQPTNIHFHGFHVSPTGRLGQYLSCSGTR